MRCSNCGAHYRLRELACPYCGTENVLGRLWQKQRSEAEEEYEKKRREAGKKASPYVYNRAVNRVLLVEVLFFVLVIVGVFLVFGVQELLGAGDSGHKADPATLSTLYQEERYGELYEAMEGDYDAYEDPERRIYMQAGLMHRSYVNFQEHRMELAAMTDEEKQRDDYHLEYSLREGLDILNVKLGYYRDLEPENEALQERYARVVRAYFLNTLKLTEEEIAELVEKEYLYQEEVKDVVRKVRKRNGW